MNQRRRILPVQASTRSGTLSAAPMIEEHHEVGPARALVWTIVAAVGLFLAWASVAPVYEVVGGNGTIVPVGEVSRLQHPEGGVIDAVLARNGDVVAAGQTLVRFDAAALDAETRKIEARLARIDRDIERARLLLEIDLARPDAADHAAANLADAPDLIEEIALRRAQLDVLRKDREVADRQRRIERGKLSAQTRELRILTARRDRYDLSGEGRAVTRFQIDELSRDILRLGSAVSTLRGEDTVAEATIARILAQEAELVASYRREAALRLSASQEERSAAEETLIQIADRRARTDVRAPVDGIVQALAVAGPGNVVAPGAVILEVVPTGGAVFAEIAIPAERIGGVSVGQDASLKILTYDFTRFGDVAAVVDRISPSSHETPDGRRVFTVALRFDATGLTPGDAGGHTRPITAGMTVSASVRSDRRSILSYLLKPARVISDRAFTEA